MRIRLKILKESSVCSISEGIPGLFGEYAMKHNKLMQLSVVFLGLLLFSAPASANTAIPFFVAGWIGMVLALVPIIVVEAIVLSLGFGFSGSRSALVSGIVNLVSTVVGIPMAVAILQSQQSLIFENGSLSDFSQRFNTPWKKLLAALFIVPLGSSDDADHLTGAEKKALDWMESVAILALLVSLFLSSWFIETMVAAFLFDPLYSSQLPRGILVANSVSYGLLLIVVVAMFISHANESSVELPQLQVPRPEVAHELVKPDIEGNNVSPLGRRATKRNKLAYIRSIQHKSRFQKNRRPFADREGQVNTRVRDVKTQRVG